jgi:hypothetical protein
VRLTRSRNLFNIEISPSLLLKNEPGAGNAPGSSFCF